MAREVRQGCPASGFLFAMAFDPIFRWLQESNIPRIPDNLDFLQVAQCAYADDLAVASSSFRELMVGTMIGPDGHIQRWMAHRNIIHRVVKIHASTKNLVERLCDFKIYAISVLSFIGSVCATDKATLKAENHALQCTTAEPYNAITSKLLEVGSVYGLGPGLCEMGEIVKGDEGPVSGVAQVVCHGVKVVGAHGEEGRERDGEVQGEVKGEVEQLRDNRTCAWREDGMTDSRNLSQVECDESNEDTKDRVQVCSIVHVAHVHVRRVTAVIVHIGHQDVVLVVMYFCVFRSHFCS